MHLVRESPAASPDGKERDDEAVSGLETTTRG
jgi:hypothetical protein